MIKVNRIETKETYVFVELEGTISVKDAIESGTKAITACYESGMTNLLVEFSKVTGNLSPVERFEYGSKVAEAYSQKFREYRKPLKIALCGKEPVIDPQRLGENVAYNRGVNQKAFTNFEQALQWLLAPDN